MPQLRNTWTQHGSGDGRAVENRAVENRAVENGAVENGALVRGAGETALDGNGSGADRPGGQPAPKRRFGAERAWIGIIVGYSVLRFVVAWEAMGDYGVNPWLFGLIDVGTAWPYAKSTAGMVKAGWAGRWASLVKWSVLALLTFFAPYAYLWSAGNAMPASVQYGLALVVGLLFVVASLGVIRKIKSGPAA